MRVHQLAVQSKPPPVMGCVIFITFTAHTSPIYHEGTQEQLQRRAIHARNSVRNMENKQIKTQMRV